MQSRSVQSLSVETDRRRIKEKQHRWLAVISHIFLAPVGPPVLPAREHQDAELGSSRWVRHLLSLGVSSLVL